MMIPTLTVTIVANKTLHSHAAVSVYLDEIEAQHSHLAHYRNALREVVNTEQDELVMVYDIPAMEGGVVSTLNGTRLLWMPEIGRAALNSYQSGDWQWTDAYTPEDALARYRSGENGYLRGMAP